jgi:hypothetical protein
MRKPILKEIKVLSGNTSGYANEDFFAPAKRDQ